MIISIVSKNYGSQKINTENYIPQFAATDSTAFKVVEHIWNNWFDHATQPGAPMGKDIQGMYYGEGDQPAIYTKKGAIRQGIENIIEYCLEKGTASIVVNTKDIIGMDVECAFE